MSLELAPTNLTELADAVRSASRLLAVGAETKPGLSAVDAQKLSTARLKGIVEYEPSEFTFTALAGTPIKEIIAALAERGQYLPFDPLLVDGGATLGGTVASGLSGPGRFRFGGIRDFILGVKFVDGRGRLLRMGGKVVKNAAGFDLPKFFVGSLGRFGVLGEITFKVFPRRVASLTLKLTAKDIESASQILTEAAHTRWELDALDLHPDGDVYARLAGPEAAMEAIAIEIMARWPGKKLPGPEAESLWTGLREFGWADRENVLVKVPLTAKELPALKRASGSLNAGRLHASAGGNVAYISASSNADWSGFDRELTSLGLAAVTLRGNGSIWRGRTRPSKISQAIKAALDPENRFPAIEA
jgi:glycolate oxidase FAD binding subunit